MGTDCGLRGLPLIDASIAAIEADPDGWNQDRIRCSSGLCVAGHGVELAGGEWAFPEDDPYSDALLPVPQDYPEGPILISSHGTYTIAWHRARRLMEITYEEALDLFGGDNDLADIKDARDRIAARMAAARR